MGAMYVMDLPRQFFMIRFDKEEEYMAALTGGPWRVFGSHLMSQAWSPEFDLMKDEIVTTPAWVRLSNIPVNFYHKSILMGIARGLGKPIKVDPTTLQFERARFARVCVEVNLKKPLKGTVVINGERYFVSYEGFTNICAGCGLYGHMVHNCPRVRQDNEMSMVPVIASSRKNPTVINQVDDGFTMVGKSGKQAEKNPAKTVFAAGSSGSGLGKVHRDLGKKKDLNNIALSNSFGSLRSDMEIPDPSEVMESLEGNKENVNIPNQVREVNLAGQGLVVPLGENQRRGNGGGRLLNKEKRPGYKKAGEHNGPKPKQLNSNRPARGLIFGPTREDLLMSSSGKRLRVERTNPVGTGGFSAQRVEGSPQGDNSVQQVAITDEVTQMDSSRASMPMEEAMHNVPLDSTKGNNAA